MTAEEDILIEKFLQHRLTEEEKVVFGRKMESSMEFKQKVLYEAKMVSYLQVMDKMDVKKEVESIYSTYKAKKSTPKLGVPLHRNPWFYTAASFLLLYLVIVFYSTRKSAESVYDEYYTLMIYDEFKRDADQESELVAVFQAYNNGQFLEVIEPLKQWATNHDHMPGIWVFLGNAYLNVDEAQNAINTFKQVPRGHAYFHDAQWYLSLSYLKLSKYDNAITCLDTLIEKSIEYRDRATTLKSEIQQLSD